MLSLTVFALLKALAPNRVPLAVWASRDEFVHSQWLSSFAFSAAVNEGSFLRSAVLADALCQAKLIKRIGLGKNESKRVGSTDFLHHYVGKPERLDQNSGRK